MRILVIAAAMAAVGWPLSAPAQDYDEPIEEIIADMKEVAEGVKSSKSVIELGNRHGVEMPIAEQIYRIIYEQKSPQEAVTDLMRRALKPENVI